MADCNGYKAPKTTLHHRSRRRRRSCDRSTAPAPEPPPPRPDPCRPPRTPHGPLTTLDEITRRLRRECPWDREQDERTIVPHTRRGGLRAGRRRAPARRRQAARRARRRAVPGPLPGAAARGARRRRSAPGRRARHREADPPPPARVRRDRGRERRRGAAQLGRDQAHRGRAASPGSSARCPRTCPSLLYARKVQRRVASSGFDFPGVDAPAAVACATSWPSWRPPRPPTSASTSSAICCSRPSTWPASCKVDPELALRAASDRFRGRVTTAAELAASEGGSWNDLPPEEQLGYYARARLTEGDDSPR